MATIEYDLTEYKRKDGTWDTAGVSTPEQRQALLARRGQEGWTLVTSFIFEDVLTDTFMREIPTKTDESK